MKKIKLIALFAALIVGLGLYQFLKEIGKPQETPRTPVVVAAMDIPQNVEITPEMIRLEAIATEALLPNHVRDVNSVVGMVLSSDVYAGEQIVTNRLVRVGEAEDKSNTLAYVVKNGMRAVTVPVNPTTGTAYLLKPGNRVDVLMHYTYETEIEAEEDPEAESESRSEPKTVQVNASRLLLQNVEVLAVASTLSRSGAESYETVTLEVSPEDAVKLGFANFTGSVQLVLRSSLDNEEADVPEINLDVIQGKEEKP